MLVLHVGYLLLPIGLALPGAAMFGSAVPTSAAIHALTAGAMATMILAVMTRATLWHTGRDLRAGPATVLIYLLVTAGAVLRVTAPLGLLAYRLGLELSGTAWGCAFLVFLGSYGPILFRPRLGELS